MRSRLVLVVLFGAVVLGALYYAEKAWATDPSGFTGSTVPGTPGKFRSFDVFNAKVLENSTAGRHKNKRKLWLSWQKTRGTSDVYVQNNVWQPGGYTGWHTHPGHSLIIVTAGEVTTYEGDDPKCTPHVYKAGEGFVDAGGDHVHNIRNETNAVASTIAVQVIPARLDGSSSASDRRVGAPDPGNCSF